MRTFILGSMLALFQLTAFAGGPPPSDGSIRATVQKSIPHIEREGWKWIKSKKCLSCHMIPFMQWSLHEAERRGIDIDSPKLLELDQYVQSKAPQVDPEKKPKSSDTSAQIVVSRAGYGEWEEKPLQPWHRQIIRAQKENGQWGAGGQLPRQKRPSRETEEVSTMWSLLAIRSLESSTSEDQALQDSAREWLARSSIAKQQSAKSTEWFAMRLLLESKWGDEASIAAARMKLFSLQREDGGWGWLTDQDSDALATGQILWTLTQCGLTTANQEVRQSIRFLLDTQREDGTWRVESTRANDKGAVKPTSVYWGTTWAVIGLTQVLPPA